MGDRSREGGEDEEGVVFEGVCGDFYEDHCDGFNGLALGVSGRLAWVIDGMSECLM